MTTIDSRLTCVPASENAATESGTAIRQLLLVVVVMTLTMSVWFATAAVVPSLISVWHISSGGASWLTSAVQVGFVAGALASAVLNLADRVRVGTLIAASAVLAALSTALVPLVSHGLGTAIPLRFLTGFALAGVYPAGTKLVASWFDGARGLAMGALVAALTVGSAMPHLVTALGNPAWHLVLLITAGLALAGGAVAPALEYGPRAAPPAPLQVGYVVRMFADRRQRDVNLGYFGHMWELYAFWTWLPLYLSGSFAAAGGRLEGSAWVSVATFVAAGGAGAVGCVAAGFLALKRSPIRLARFSLFASGTCCALSPLVFGSTPVAVIVLVLIWGFFVISDSPMFSTVLSEVADPRYVGTALTAQMAIGFLVTTVAIRAVPLVAADLGLRWALSILAIGPAFGLLSVRFGGGVAPVPGPAAR